MILRISKTWKIDWFIGQDKIPKDEYDFVMFWDDSNSRFFKELHRYSCPKGLCLTTDPHNKENLKTLDVVYVESDPIYNALRPHGVRTIKAFGTDTSLFKPKDVDKDIRYFYPATFSPWKRQSAIAHLGEDLLCVGTVQPDGRNELEACKEADVRIETGYFPANKIVDYYQRTQQMIIPAIHGSERTVLEAMACNIVPEVNEKNIRTNSYVKEYNNYGFRTPREFVLDRYSHEVYARKLLEGMEND